MGDGDGGETQRQPQENEKNQQRDPDHYFRGNEREIEKRFDSPAAAKPMPAQRQGQQGPEKSSNQCCRQAYQQAQLEAVEDLGSLEQSMIPAEGEALPFHREL